MAIKYLYERKTRTEVSDLLNCHSQTLSTWIDKFLEGGLKNLLELMTHQVSSRLNIEQKQELKIMILEELPRDYVVVKRPRSNKIIHQCLVGEHP